MFFYVTAKETVEIICKQIKYDPKKIKYNTFKWYKIK